MDHELSRMRKYTCEKIKYYRRINNYSQAAMAEKLWMSTRAYHRLENGETALTIDRIHQIARIFQVSVSHLIGPESELRNRDIVGEIKSLNIRHMENEQKIIEILKELKDRID